MPSFLCRLPRSEIFLFLQQYPSTVICSQPNFLPAVIGVVLRINNKNNSSIYMHQ
ncbi:hypothetical protein C0J52_25793 [Blattella germanica]|nr:hypothetical protein C0J52_25793 [Blattella germanica]